MFNMRVNIGNVSERENDILFITVAIAAQVHICARITILNEVNVQTEVCLNHPFLQVGLLDFHLQFLADSAVFFKS